MMTIEPPSTISIACTRRVTALLLAVLPIVFAATAQSQSAATATPASQWQLSWSDEFNGANGSSPDPEKWAFDNAGDLYNGELETYTSRAANVQQRDRHLVIRALNEETTRPDGTTRHYTSGRIVTQGHFAQTYGRFEARIKMPLGKGIWPAFWMLGDDIGTVGWPGCGEIDIFENIGDASTIYSTLHSVGAAPAGVGATFKLPAGEAVDTAYHLYVMEWAPKDIKFFFDDKLIAERTPADLPAGAKWAFDHPYFILLNLAVGGGWPGSPDQTTKWPQEMLVDYVRVYKRAPQAVAGATGTTGR
jgi:beta-glucanase (GH16 family)